MFPLARYYRNPVQSHLSVLHDFGVVARQLERTACKLQRLRPCGVVCRVWPAVKTPVRGRTAKTECRRKCSLLGLVRSSERDRARSELMGTSEHFFTDNPRRPTALPLKGPFFMFVFAILVSLTKLTMNPAWPRFLMASPGLSARIHSACPPPSESQSSPQGRR